MPHVRGRAEESGDLSRVRKGQEEEDTLMGVIKKTIKKGLFTAGRVKVNQQV